MFCSVVLLLVSLQAAPAARQSAIEPVGVEAVDAIFEEANQIEEAVFAARKARRDARHALSAALGLDEAATTFPDAIAALRTRAGGSLTVRTVSGVPTLSADDPALAAAVAAANNASQTYTALSKDLASLTTRCARLEADIQALDVVSATLDLVEQSGAQQLEQIQANISDLSALPKKVAHIQDGLTSDLAALAASG